MAEADLRGSSETTTRRSQLGYGYDAVKHIYDSSLTFITIAAGADAALITFSIEAESQAALALGGVVVLVTLMQLRHAGRALVAAAATVLWLEAHLGLGNSPSPMAAFLGAAFGPERLEHLRAVASAKPSMAVDQHWINEVSRHAVFRFRGTMLLALVLAIGQIVGALAWHVAA